MINRVRISQRGGALSFLLVCLLASLGQSHADVDYHPTASTVSTEDNNENSEFIGLYRNLEYGFSLRVPRTYRGAQPGSPAPRHGVRIALNKGGFIWADGSYNAEEYQTPTDAASVSLDRIQNEGGTILSVQRRVGHLDTLASEHTVVRYRNNTSHEDLVEEYIVALRSLGEDEKRTGIVYSVGMSCRENEYAKTKKLFGELVSSWKIQHIAE